MDEKKATEIVHESAQVDNLTLWNRVCTTDPAHTKKVSLGRTFTAIDAMYQIMKATEEMGVAGEGWGFRIMEKCFLPTDQVAIRIRMWRGSRENYIEQWGQNGLYIDKGKTKPDEDCMKKATTDGVTKCLSYFGFNADVFLGKFDDNKYVEALKAEFSGEEKKADGNSGAYKPKPKPDPTQEKRTLIPEKAQKAAEEFVADIEKKLTKCTTDAEVDKLHKDNIQGSTRIQEGYPVLYSRLNKAFKEAIERVWK